jgi:hypothetical protein
MLNTPVVKNIVSALAVTVFGAVLLILTFLLDFLAVMVIGQFLGPFLQAGFERTFWFPPLTQAVFALVVAVITWAVFKAKLPEIYKAAYTIVPTAVALVVAAILAYLYRARESWIYHYAVLLVALVLLIMGLTGTDI